MSIDMILLIAAIMAILYVGLETAKNISVGVAVILFALFTLILFNVYQSAKADEVQVFAGVELKTPYDVKRLIKELQEELAKPTPKPKEE